MCASRNVHKKDVHTVCPFEHLFGQKSQVNLANELNSNGSSSLCSKVEGEVVGSSPTGMHV
jgi:hypothetical protein